MRGNAIERWGEEKSKQDGDEADPLSSGRENFRPKAAVPGGCTQCKGRAGLPGVGRDRVDPEGLPRKAHM